MNYNYIYTTSIDGVGSGLFQITNSVKMTDILSTFAKYCFKTQDTVEYFSHFILLHYLECRDKIDFGICNILDDLEGIDFKGEIPKSQERFKKYILSFRKLYKNKPDSITALDFYLNLLRFKSKNSFVDSQELVLWLVCGLHLLSDKGAFINAISALVDEYLSVFGRLFIDISCCIFDTPFDSIKDICKAFPCLSYSICDSGITFKTGTLADIINNSLREYDASVISFSEKSKHRCKVSHKNIRQKNTSSSTKSSSDNTLHFESISNNTKSFDKRSINFGNHFFGNSNSCVIGGGVTMVTSSNGTIINSKIKIPAGHSVSVVGGKVYVDNEFYCNLNGDDVNTSPLSDTKKYVLTDNDDDANTSPLSDTKKYELTDNTIIYKSVVLHQIRALQNFNNVKVGDLGGFVEKESNLSQKGTCWVYDSAKVYGNVKLMGTSIVSDKAVVTGNATIIVCIIEDNSVFNASGNIKGILTMSDDSHLSGRINLMGELTMTDSSSIQGSIDCYGKIFMEDSSVIKDILKCSGKLTMSDNSSMSGNSSIYGLLSMCDNTAVKNVNVYSVVDLCDNSQISNSVVHSVLKLNDNCTLTNHRG